MQIETIATRTASRQPPNENPMRRSQVAQHRPAVPDHHEIPERGFRPSAFNLCRGPSGIYAGDKARASAAFVFILSDL
jgi:hypothetical protein